MKSRIIFSPYFLLFLFGLVITAGCLHDTNSHQNQTSVNDVNATAIEIALNNSTVRSFIGQGYTIAGAGPVTIGINEMSLTVTGVQFDTPQDLIGVNVDVQNRSIVNIWTLPKRSPQP